MLGFCFICTNQGWLRLGSSSTSTAPTKHSQEIWVCSRTLCIQGLKVTHQSAVWSYSQWGFLSGNSVSSGDGLLVWRWDSRFVCSELWVHVFVMYLYSYNAMWCADAICRTELDQELIWWWKVSVPHRSEFAASKTFKEAFKTWTSGRPFSKLQTKPFLAHVFYCYEWMYLETF